jgi:hypothetical protein
MERQNVFLRLSVEVRIVHQCKLIHGCSALNSQRLLNGASRHLAAELTTLSTETVHMLLITDSSIGSFSGVTWCPNGTGVY